jgi:glycosyltransferase involved in cell wall biosynthesis
VKIFVLTDIPSPYQTEIFDEITASGCDLYVGYLRGSDPTRQWRQTEIRHQATMLDETNDPFASANELMDDCDLAVFNYYRHAQAEQLLSHRARQQRPWCFWGERPGFTKPEWPGRVLRHWKLRSLHSSPAAIWGIGQFAVDQYKREFGTGRAYFNLPYFSNLERFRVERRTDSYSRSDRVFLFSGSLTTRKGVDVLSKSFCQLVSEQQNVRLRIVGDGPLLKHAQNTMSAVRDKVDFVGFRDWRELPQQYASADVLCVPSRYDGWGLVVPEGLAAGLPVIATDQMGAALEFVRTDYNGWLIGAGDETALLRAMREAASLSSEQLTKYSSNAVESVSQHSLQHGAQRFLQYARNSVAHWRA